MITTVLMIIWTIIFACFIAVETVAIVNRNKYEHIAESLSFTALGLCFAMVVISIANLII